MARRGAWSGIVFAAPPFKVGLCYNPAALDTVPGMLFVVFSWGERRLLFESLPLSGRS